MTLFAWNERNRYKPNQYNAGNIRECSSIIENISFLVNNRIDSKLSVARTELMYLNRYRGFKQFLILLMRITRFIPQIFNILIVLEGSDFGTLLINLSINIPYEMFN